MCQPRNHFHSTPKSSSHTVILQFEFSVIFVRKFTCILGKLQTKSMSLIGNSISPEQQRSSFAHCTIMCILLCHSYMYMLLTICLLFKSACPEKSKIERQISKFQNRSNLGFQWSILNYLSLCGSFVKWCFVSAENDGTRFRGQALKNQAQKLDILKLTACRNHNPRRHPLAISLFYIFCRFYLTILMTFEKQ